MPDVKEVKFQSRHWDVGAGFVVNEWSRRKNHKARAEKERIWKEVDRQVQMIPISVDKIGSDGKPVVEKSKQDHWFPNTELPLQATALEVLQADARRLTFPRGAEWFLAHSNVSDKYIQDFQERRETVAFVAGEPIPMSMDQESADVLVKATLNHFHKMFNFRANANFLDVEALKYGTYAGRVREAMVPEFSADLAGIKKTSMKGPAFIPVSIKHLYLDDTPQAVMMEGVSVEPAHIREWWQRREDLIRAAKSGGEGWITPQIARIELTDPDTSIHMLEFEGDLVIPNSRDHSYLPNSILTVAVGEGPPRAVRYRTGSPSYVTGTYEKEDMVSPYGTSPLMKGQPLQEIASLMTNCLAATAALSAKPPVFYDDTDARVVAAGGPILEPGSKQAIESPRDTVVVLDKWNISDITAALAMVLGQYEDLTGVTAPRRGAQTKSHTTAFAVDVENTRGLVRTDDYVEAKEKGPLLSILQREYKVIKKVMTATPVFVGTAGIEGFAMISRQDLPETVDFEVIGSAGPTTERERQQLRDAAIDRFIQIGQFSAQAGGPVPNFDEIMKEALSGQFANTARFITSAQGVPNAAPAVGGVQGPAGVVQNEQT